MKLTNYNHSWGMILFFDELICQKTINMTSKKKIYRENIDQKIVEELKKIPKHNKDRARKL